MQAWVRRLLQDARFTGLRGRLENLVPLSIQLDRHAADALERQGDHAGCGHAHAALAAAHPGHERADEALYNAALCFERASLMREATQSAEELVRRFPRSALRERARELIGRLQGAP
jgi:TolA-binding protein